MTRTLWILAGVTLAVQVALRVFGGTVERALFAENWSPVLMATTISLAVNALLILTAGAGIYVAGRARRGGWIALFAVALVLALYGPTAAAVVLPRLSLGRAIITALAILDIALGLLVPLLALAYALRYRATRATLAPARTDGG